MHDSSEHTKQRLVRDNKVLYFDKVPSLYYVRT